MFWSKPFLAAVRRTASAGLALTLPGCGCGAEIDTDQVVFVDETSAAQMLADGEVTAAECSSYCEAHAVLLSHSGCDVAQAPDSSDTGDTTELALTCSGTTTYECE